MKVRFAAKGKSNFPMYQWPLKWTDTTNHDTSSFPPFCFSCSRSGQCSWCTQLMDSCLSGTASTVGSIVVFSLLFPLISSPAPLVPSAPEFLLLEKERFPASDVPLRVFSLPKVLHVQANKNLKNYTCEQPKMGFFSSTKSLHFDTRCLRLLVLQFFTLLRRSLLKAGHSNSSVNCRKYYFVL